MDMNPDTLESIAAMARVNPKPDNSVNPGRVAQEKGDQALREGDLAKALLYYDEAVAHSSNLVLAKRKKALVLQELGRADEALTLLYEELNAKVGDTATYPLLLAKIAKLTFEAKGEKALEKVVRLGMKMAERNEADAKARNTENNPSFFARYQKEAFTLSRRAQAWIAIGLAFDEMGDVEGIDLAYSRAMHECNYAPYTSLLFVRLALKHGDYETASQRVEAIRAPEAAMAKIRLDTTAAIALGGMKYRTPEQRKEYLAEGLRIRANTRRTLRIGLGL